MSHRRLQRNEQGKVGTFAGRLPRELPPRRSRRSSQSGTTASAWTRAVAQWATMSMATGPQRHRREAVAVHSGRNGYFTIKAQHSGRCLSIYEADTRPGPGAASINRPT
jgi:hypothetical protein